MTEEKPKERYQLIRGMEKLGSGKPLIDMDFRKLGKPMPLPKKEPEKEEAKEASESKQ